MKHKSRKPKSLLRAVEKLRFRAGERRDSKGKRIRRGQPIQESFAAMYLD